MAKRKFKKNSQLLSLIVVALLIVGVVAAVAASRKSTESRSQASGVTCAVFPWSDRICSGVRVDNSPPGDPTKTCVATGIIGINLPGVVAGKPKCSAVNSGGVRPKGPVGAPKPPGPVGAPKPPGGLGGGPKVCVLTSDRVCYNQKPGYTYVSPGDPRQMYICTMTDPATQTCESRPWKSSIRSVASCDALPDKPHKLCAGKDIGDRVTFQGQNFDCEVVGNKCIPQVVKSVPAPPQNPPVSPQGPAPKPKTQPQPTPAPYFRGDVYPSGGCVQLGGWMGVAGSVSTPVDAYVYVDGPNAGGNKGFGPYFIRANDMLQKSNSVQICQALGGGTICGLKCGVPSNDFDCRHTYIGKLTDINADPNITGKVDLFDGASHTFYIYAKDPVANKSAEIMHQGAQHTISGC